MSLVFVIAVRVRVRTLWGVSDRSRRPPHHRQGFPRQVHPSIANVNRPRGSRLILLPAPIASFSTAALVGGPASPGGREGDVIVFPP